LTADCTQQKKKSGNKVRGEETGEEKKWKRMTQIVRNLRKED